MRAILTTAAAAALLIAATSTAAQTTAPRQERPTTGDCVSDGFLGNEPNIEGPAAPGGPQEQAPGSAAGRVAPSQSPGPFINTGANPPPRNDRTRGLSVGEANQLLKAGAVPGVTAQNVPQACKTLIDPAR
jgi:hypothetical protein